MSMFDFLKTKEEGNTGNFGEKTELVQEFENRLSSAKQAMAPLTREWNEYIRLYNAEHWDDKLPAYKVRSTYNLIYSIVESQLALLTDRSPEIVVEAQTKDDMESAEKLNKVMSFIWNKIGMQKKFKAVLRDFLLFGTGILKVYWDTEKYNQMGEVGVEVCNIFDVFIDPSASEIQEAQYVIYKTTKPLSVIQRNYANGYLVKSNYQYATDENKRYVKEDPKQYARDLADIFEYWYKDKQSGELKLGTISNGVELEHRPTPFETEKYPFVVLTDHKLNSLYGMSQIRQVKDDQYILNKLRSIIVENALKTTNTVWLVPTNSGIGEKTITDIAGQTIRYNFGAKPERVAPQGLPGYVQNETQSIKQSMEDRLGSFDVARGLADSGVIAYSAISQLTENATSRIKSKLGDVEEGIQALGEWFLILVRSFYSEPRFIKVSGSTGKIDFDYFDNSDIRQEETVTDPQTGEEQTIIHLTEFDIRIQGGSSMLLNKASKFQQALELYKSDALSWEKLMEYADMGSIEEIRQQMIAENKLPDPNAQTPSTEEILQSITSKLKFSVSSTDPIIIKDALDEVFTRAKAGEPDAQEAVGLNEPIDPSQMQGME